MKTFFKSFGILAIIGIAIVSCVELEEFQLVTKIIKEPVSIDVNFIPASLEECPYGGHKTQIIIEGQEFTSPPTCNGEPGEDFDISDLNITSEINPISELCNEWIFYVNGEEFFRKEVCDGEPGEDGEDAEPYVPVFTTEKEWIDELCWLRRVFLDGELFYEDTICNGQPGVSDTIVFVDTVFVSSVDTIVVVQIDSIFVVDQDTIIERYHYKYRTLCFDFNNPGNTPSYEEKGWKFSPGTSANQIDSKNGNGTLCLYRYWEYRKGHAWTPYFEPESLHSVKLDFGSSGKEWLVGIQTEFEDGRIATILEDKFKGIPEGFVWYKSETYGEPILYHAPLEKLEHHNVVRIGIYFKATDCWDICTRNQSFNVDNMCITLVEVYKEVICK